VEDRIHTVVGLSSFHVLVWYSLPRLTRCLDISNGRYCKL